MYVELIEESPYLLDKNRYVYYDKILIITSFWGSYIMESMFYINNTDRRYLGLPEIKNHREMITLGKGDFIFLEGNTITKFIRQQDTFYFEYTLNEMLSEDRIWLLPKTEKGKKIKLSSSTIMNKTPIGTYFRWMGGDIVIGNYSTQKTFYSTHLNNIVIKDVLKLREWLKTWKDNTTDILQKSMEVFSNEPRKHVQFKEGDIFTIKYDRNLYGFGRILLDVSKLRKQKKGKFSDFMGKPVLIKQYAFLSNSNKIDISILDQCFSFPSIYIMDNALYYGHYEIIGHKDLNEQDKDYPIQYYKSIDARNPDIINLYIGDLYQQIKLSTNKYHGSFGQRGIGFEANIDVDMLNKCIDDNSLNPYWNSTEYRYHGGIDLRNPALKQTKEAILRQFNIIEE